MRQLLSIFQVAKLLNVSTMTIRRMWADGRMPPPLRIGKRSLRWNADELEEWLVGCSEEQTEQEQAEQEQEA